jgi:hypothetical protein
LQKGLEAPTAGVSSKQDTLELTTKYHDSRPH